MQNIGLTFTTSGAYDAIASRGRHIGWPFLVGTSLFSLLAISTI